MPDSELKAPRGLYRVVGVDAFSGEDWVDGDFPSRASAITHARDRVVGKQMLKMHVYDDQGNHLFDAGTF